ncbi:MAG TPA: bifunctional phosphoribosylaminoimidazolecarboxamide formyltransferase/IMP cyclohydrolase [Verrucomicrobiales bacterium]|nr:bifunctional phosphoribosylaminoimidazolecarboxamide formyltransferase/IMP cyclohydrolase [Verrucomicrobiales bacterium]
MKISRALLSVSDKTGVALFAAKLSALGVELLSTGGTARVLRDAGLAVRDVSDYTGFPELFGGRVKTLHPMIHGGLLYRRDEAGDVRDAAEHGIGPIDLLVVNLYPFEATTADGEATLEEAVEEIDIGGPALLRAAAKNHTAVTVLTDPADYAAVLAEIEESGATSLDTRRRLASKVYLRTAAYDAAIGAYLERAQGGEAGLLLSRPFEQRLRYGDNPHQKAALYGRFSECFRQLQGKELSYTNVLDIASAAELIGDFDEPTVGILKHTNPCGVGSDADLGAAWDKAFATDRQAPFGGVIVCNRPVDRMLADRIGDIFVDIIIAPGFEEPARERFRKKKNVRMMELRPEALAAIAADAVIRSVPGGILVMDGDARALGLDEWEDARRLGEAVRTKRVPSAEEWAAMRFGWRVVRQVKSNAVVFAAADRTLGIGAGQMSRVDACQIAVWKAGEAGLDLRGSAVASDAMFPFADGLIAAAEAGATAAIQPGGSLRDAEVIAAADTRNLAMVFTGFRHFRH